MEENLLDYADYPTHEESHELHLKKEEVLDKIFLREEGGKQSFSIMSSEGIMNLELSHWLMEYNNKAIDLITNYKLLMHHYNKGIPDTEWYGAGQNGGIRYFPHFEQKHFLILYWFAFYMDSYYMRFASLLDTMYHIINVKYYLGIEPKLGFKRDVMKVLKSKDKDLHDYLHNLKYNNEIYEAVEHFRNNITHNFRPNQIDSGIKRVKKDGYISISGGVGNYTTTTEFVTNIEQSLDLLAEIVENIREKLEP